jgi:DNA polymerase I-like protein with 3'-5' exonuclease and polymerase domains
MLVHDEIVIEAPEERAHEAAMELARLMIVAMKMWCPDVPARASPVVSRCWSKDAEQVWENGQLVPWDLPEEKENVA